MAGAVEEMVTPECLAAIAEKREGALGLARERLALGAEGDAPAHAAEVERLWHRAGGPRPQEKQAWAPCPQFVAVATIVEGWLVTAPSPVAGAPTVTTVSLSFKVSMRLSTAFTERPGTD